MGFKDEYHRSSGLKGKASRDLCSILDWGDLVTCSLKRGPSSISTRADLHCSLDDFHLGQIVKTSIDGFFHHRLLEHKLKLHLRRTRGYLIPRN